MVVRAQRLVQISHTKSISLRIVVLYIDFVWFDRFAKGTDLVLCDIMFLLAWDIVAVCVWVIVVVVLKCLFVAIIAWLV